MEKRQSREKDEQRDKKKEESLKRSEGIGEREEGEGRVKVVYYNKCPESSGGQRV
jgi:hypothetical protein